MSWLAQAATAAADTAQVVDPKLYQGLPIALGILWLEARLLPRLKRAEALLAAVATALGVVLGSPGVENVIPKAQWVRDVLAKALRSPLAALLGLLQLALGVVVILAALTGGLFTPGCASSDNARALRRIEASVVSWREGQAELDRHSRRVANDPGEAAAVASLSAVLDERGAKLLELVRASAGRQE